MSDEGFKDLIGKVKSIKSNDSVANFKKRVINTDALSPRQIKKTNSYNDSLDESCKPLPVSSEELVSYVKSGYSKQILKKLKQEKFPVALEIDLHHMTEVDAKKYLLKTIGEQSYPYNVSIRIIHGKSRNVSESNNYPILKNMVVGVLASHYRVVAYVSSNISQGGAGATLALIKKCVI